VNVKKEDWNEHKKTCGQEKKIDEEDDSFYIPPPKWKVKLTINGKNPSSHETQLSIDPLSVLLTEAIRTIVKDGNAIRFSLDPEDIVDVDLSWIEDETQNKQWLGIKAEDFVNMTNCGRCAENCRFGATGTRYDCWNYQDLFFRGLCLGNKEYPGKKS